MLLAIAGFAVFLFVLAVYAFYFFLVYRREFAKNEYLGEIDRIEKMNIDLPPVSVIVNTFNEAKIIRRKIESISNWSYPSDKLEVLVVNDSSTDETATIAENALADFEVKGNILNTPRRIGLNKSLNLAFENVSNCIVCVTDSDALLDRDALKKAVLVLESFEGAGGVTGKVVPTASVTNMASSSESNYRSYYHQSMLSDSCCHSAFPGNGPMIVFNRSLVIPFIPTTYGSTDANLAMNIVKCGRRFLYVPDALIFEPVPESFGQQKLQKARRAKRLIQVFLHNFDVFGNKRYHKFGTLIFPLKFLMHVVCPFMAFLSLILLSSFLITTDVLFLRLGFLLLFALYLVTLAVSNRVRKFSISFVSHQFYLLLGLFTSFRKSVFWKTIERR